MSTQTAVILSLALIALAFVVNCVLATLDRRER